MGRAGQTFVPTDEGLSPNSSDCQPYSAYCCARVHFPSLAEFWRSNPIFKQKPGANHIAVPFFCHIWNFDTPGPLLDVKSRDGSQPSSVLLKKYSNTIIPKGLIL
ncbi:hypothetical protein [Aurantiacibacter marinus]|uniref:hypothetical protein n=1 Tax=Aurantiacibacter marinus TaxID=874156 RepID=UPI000B23137E|nr:hypothetical protein [Aurantiacibacter marinus]